jgi:triacylglycerol lipase
MDAAILEQQVRRLGAVFNEEINAATRSIYRAHVELTSAGEERLDVAYGEHPRHKLDVYLPGGRSRGTVVYVHGGGFVAGDKRGDDVFYTNIGRWLARNGWTAVLPNYRLAPAAPWPAGTRDLESVMQWVYGHALELAPREAPVVVWGQSAGAAHVASWLFDPSARGSSDARASAVMLMSGFYKAEAPLNKGALAYFDTEETLYESRSALSHVCATHIPIWLSLAELDPASIAQHTYALARAVTLATGRSPDFRLFRGHNHVSTVQSIGTCQLDVAVEVLQFLNRLNEIR